MKKNHKDNFGKIEFFLEPQMTFKTIKQTINPTQVILKLCSSRNLTFTNVVVIFFFNYSKVAMDLLGFEKAVLYSLAELSASVCWWGLCSWVGMSESMPLRSPPTSQGLWLQQGKYRCTFNWQLLNNPALVVISLASQYLLSEGLQIYVFWAGVCIKHRLSRNHKSTHSGGERTKYWGDISWGRLVPC